MKNSEKLAAQGRALLFVERRLHVVEQGVGLLFDVREFGPLVVVLDPLELGVVGLDRPVSDPPSALGHGREFASLGHEPHAHHVRHAAGPLHLFLGLLEVLLLRGQLLVDPRRIL